MKKAAAVTNSFVTILTIRMCKKQIMLARLPYQATSRLEVTCTQTSLFVKLNLILKVKDGSLVYYSKVSKNHHKIYVRIGNNILYNVNKE